jgi:butyryl-CoA dehydrogenase
MIDRFVSERNVKFILYEVFDLEGMTKIPYFREHNKKLFDMVLGAAMKLSKDLFFPYVEEMDQKPPELVDGQVKVHPTVRKVMRESGDGGWITASFPASRGGEQLPLMLNDACRFIFAAANYSSSVYPSLTAGAARLIINFASKDLNDTYIPKMFAGQWQGTMALTEPAAGSSLADITTTATPTDKGYFMIKGQKIFISAGDHDGVDNVVHLMLARIEGAPQGIKGISMFVVPKLRPAGGSKLESNDVIVSQVFHKLGYRGCPITELAIGDKDNCRGWLVGEPNKGLSYMFQMMNESRIHIGSAAAAIACAGYYASLAYTRERTQGRKPSQKDPLSPPVPIIEHADIKRMLLFQKAIVEGAFSLVIHCAKYADMVNALENGEEKTRNELLLDILIPVVKTYPSEMGIQSVSQGLQCFGGYGYCDDFPLQQYYRDMRIHPLHEGSTGIQGIDILGRKVTMKDGIAYKLFQEEVENAVTRAKAVPGLESFAAKLSEAMGDLLEVTAHLAKVEKEKNREVYLADATVYLEFFSIITISWQWLLQAISIKKAMAKTLTPAEENFYTGKFFTCKFYFGYELPKTKGLKIRLMDPDPITVDMETRFFND